MISPVLPRIRSKLLEVLRWASVQQGWETGWTCAPIHRCFPAGEERPAINEVAMTQRHDATFGDVHIQEDEEDHPLPKVIPGSFGQTEDEDGYQRGNWRREPFATVIVASGSSDDGSEPPQDGQEAEAPQLSDVDQESVAEGHPEPHEAEDTDEEEPDPAGVVVDFVAGEDGGPGGQDLAETGAETVSEPEAPAMRVALVEARPVRRMPAPPSTGIHGSWEQDRRPWFTGRWSSDS